MKSQQTVHYHRYSLQGGESLAGEITVEMPVSLTVNGEVWLSFMCTPMHLEAMAIGFLFNEGLIQGLEEIASVDVCEHGDNVDVWLHHNVEKPTSWRRTSGCTGGVTAVETEIKSCANISPNGIALTPDKVGQLVKQLFESQELYRETGGVHTSALSDGEKLVLVTEDIGRHNTMDKIAGLCLINGIWPERRILLTTGRVSSEMLQKTTRIGASVIISRTSPSSLSIEMAERIGITLIGYARPDRFNVYTHQERIKKEPIAGSITRSHRK